MKWTKIHTGHHELTDRVGVVHARLIKCEIVTAHTTGLEWRRSEVAR